MKFINRTIIFLSIILIVSFYSCDDSGVTTPNNEGSLTLSNIQRLNQTTEGVYELWVSFQATGDHGDNDYISMGKFNVDINGKPVDTSGSSKIFTFRRQPGNVIDAQDALITIQGPGNSDTIPTGTKILGGPAVVSNDFVSFSLSMTYSEILGTIAQKFSTDTCSYILNTPTTDSTNDFYKGIWLTKDTLGQTTGLTSSMIPDTMDWIYQGWIYLLSNPDNYLNTGRFTDPTLGDDNSNCFGSQSPYDKPGHDWIDTNCTGYTVNLNNGLYGYRLTLQPKAFNTGTPFYIQIFEGGIGVAGYGSVGMINRIVNLPTGNLNISRN